MKAVILCAGEGERLRPVTENCPKVLIPVNGHPILYYVFQSLPDEITEVIMVIQEKKRAKFDDFLLSLGDQKRQTKFAYQDKEGWGTYFALVSAKGELVQEESFLYLNGDDIFLKEDLKKLILCEAPTYALSYKKLDARYRTCDLDFDTKKIVSFRLQKENEKGKELPCFSGAILLSKDFFSYKPVYLGKEAGVPHTLFGSNRNVGFYILNRWIQINNHEDLEIAHQELSEGKNV